MSKYVGGYHTLRPKEDHMSKTMANIDVKLAEQTANDPNATPMQKAIALTKINPRHAAKVHGDMMASEQAKQMQANDAQVMQSMGITPSQGNPSQLQQPVTSTPSMLELSQRIMNRAPPQEMPMPGFGLTGKQYAPVPQMQAPQQMQAPPDQMQEAPQATRLADVPTENIQRALGMVQDPRMQKMLQSELTRRNEEGKAQARVEAAQVKGDQKYMVEQRAEIAKTAAPYSDFGGINKVKKDLYQARDLIKNKKVSFDENMIRTFVSSIAAGKDLEFAESLKTADQQKLFSLIRGSLKTKTEGGSNPSQREVLLSLSAVPSYLKDKEANEFIVENLIDDIELNEVRGRIMNEVRKDKELTAPEFNEIVAEKMRPYEEQIYTRARERNELLAAKSQVADKIPRAGFIYMFDPNSGSVFEAPVEERAMLEAQKMQVLPSSRAR